MASMAVKRTAISSLHIAIPIAIGIVFNLFILKANRQLKNSNIEK
jgi:hypothetical protein